MTAPLRVGVVGLGWAGQQHLAAYDSHPDTEIVALAGLEDAPREKLATKYAIEHAVADWKDLLKVEGLDPKRADIILGGAVVVQGVLRAGGFEALETTEAGLREGVFFAEQLLAGHEPLICPAVWAVCNVIRDGSERIK